MLLLIIVLSSIKGYIALKCYEGTNCDRDCKECEGFACLKVVRHDLSSRQNLLGHPRYQYDNSLEAIDLDTVPKRIAYTCVPYDANTYDDLYEIPSCRSNHFGHESCICNDKNFCNNSFTTIDRIQSVNPHKNTILFDTMNDKLEDNIHIDDLNRLKLINSDVSEASLTLKNESQDFITKVDRFRESSRFLIDSMKELGKTVDLARLKALETRNALRNNDNEKLNEQQQLRILIRQKQMELERLKDEVDSLRQIEMQQKELKAKLQSSS
uniref:Uncharacterized protein n=1 Tax=Parastrongyloides trichosuri TaxID=131310 RepID=A0A0N4Z900_PARTI